MEPQCFLEEEIPITIRMVIILMENLMILAFGIVP